MTVKLTSIERMVCGMVGLARNSSAREKNWKMREPGRWDIGLETDIIGAYGEFAVARALNLNWNPVVGVTDTERGDVGNLQVKTVMNKGDHLLIRKNESPDFVYVMCWLSDPVTIELVGWINGRDAMVENFWNKKLPRPCYFVPQHALQPMETIQR